MTTARQQQSLGAYGERVAARYLTRQGMVLLDQNWRCRAGEIDLVLRDGDVVVVVEVKTRRGLGFGHPLAAVGYTKFERLRQLAALWVDARGLVRVPVRIDLVGVLQPRQGPPQVEHVAGIC
ncbi:MAG: YraN family protein [Marmoricola sp.]